MRGTPTERPESPPSMAVVRAELNDKRRISRTHKILMGALALAAIGFLATLKHGSQQEHALAAETSEHARERREHVNAEITKAAATQWGGESSNREQRALVARVGQAIATKSGAKQYPVALRFHLLAEPNAITLYGLSSGDIYITTALLNRMQTEGELAAALAHAAAHAIAGDALAPVTTTPPSPRPLWQHSVSEERAADALTVTWMGQAGYDPNAFSSMLMVLAKAYNAGADVGFFTTHPNAPDRLDAIRASIAATYPSGVPKELSK